MRSLIAVSLTALTVFFSGGCSEKKATEQAPVTAAPPPYDCESDNIAAEVLSDLSKRLVAGGAKGNTASALQNSLSISKIDPIEKDPRRGYSQCIAVVRVIYPDDLAARLGKGFGAYSAYQNFRDRLEDRYGVVAGSGVIAQLLEAASDGPFGNVPLAPDPETISRYSETIKKNLEVAISEKTLMTVSYQVQLDTNSNGKTVHELKTQLNGELAFDLNVGLLSANSILSN